MDILDSFLKREERVVDLVGLCMVEVLLFVFLEFLFFEELNLCLFEGIDVIGFLEVFEVVYVLCGVNLIKVVGKWCFCMVEDFSYLM